MYYDGFLFTKLKNCHKRKTRTILNVEFTRAQEILIILILVMKYNFGIKSLYHIIMITSNLTNLSYSIILLLFYLFSIILFCHSRPLLL